MKPDRVVHCRNFNVRREDRKGILLHYDDSSSDAGAVQWFGDPACHVSYNWLVLRSGELVELVPEDSRAWHAGVCRPADERLFYADANSALYGVSIAANGRERATAAQLAVVARLCAHLFERHGWSADQLWRITGHSREAWERGRKIDPEGPNAAAPVLSVNQVRAAVARLLGVTV